MTEPTIRFNVGGQRYQVSPALILHHHPESRLARLVAERGCSNDDDDEIFIDRNGDHFGHMLDLLRYGSVHLPATVSPAGFRRDLEYYGVAPTDDAAVVHDDNRPGTSAALEKVVSQAVRRELVRAAKQEPTEFVAAACASNLGTTGARATRFHDPNGQGGAVGWDMLEKIFDGNFDEEQFNESLAQHGLVFVKSRRTWGSVYIHVAELEVDHAALEKEMLQSGSTSKIPRETKGPSQCGLK